MATAARIGIPCANPECSAWFTPGPRNPDQKYCSRACKTMAYSEKRIRIYENPHKQLSCAILALAAQDWKRYGRLGYVLSKYNSKQAKLESGERMIAIANGNKFYSHRAELLAFFWGDAFELYCELAEVNPDVMRSRLGIPKLLEAAA